MGLTTSLMPTLMARVQAMTLSTDDWRSRLLEKFQSDLSVRLGYQSLYESTYPRPEAMRRYQDAYQRLLNMSRTPWARLVVDLVEERIQVNGFALDDTETENDILWSLFRQSHMEAMQSEVHREAIALGTSYVSVWPREDSPTLPKIAYESAVHVTHETVPGDPHEVAAAIKVWVDLIGGKYCCNLYLPDEVVKYQSTTNIDLAHPWPMPTEILIRGANQWDEVERITHGYGQVTMVPFVVRPDWAGYGRSDLSDVTEVIERVEWLTANTLLAVELGAFRQRWATGLEVPKDPETGHPIEPFKAALDRLWISEDPDSKFGSFEGTDIRPYLSAISDAIGQLSAVSRIPPTYFVQSDLTNPPSAASLEASETGLITKIRQRQDRFGESWEQVAILALRVAGANLPPEVAYNMNVLWEDPRTRSDAQVMDAASKMVAIGVPWVSIMEFIGYTPSEIQRMESQRAADTFNRLLAAPTPQVGGLAPVPAGLPGEPGPSPDA